MEITNKNLCSNEIRKIGLLITKAADLGFDLAGYGFADANTNSGYTYLWLESEPVTLFIDLSGDDKVNMMYTCPNCGAEFTAEASADYTKWVMSLETVTEESCFCDNCKE